VFRIKKDKKIYIKKTHTLRKALLALLNKYDDTYEFDILGYATSIDRLNALEKKCLINEFGKDYVRILTNGEKEYIKIRDLADNTVYTIVKEKNFKPTGLTDLEFEDLLKGKIVKGLQLVS
jgi:hypothetical protein